MMVSKVSFSRTLGLCLAFLWGVNAANAQSYPPLSVEIGPYHPLLLFAAPGDGSGETSDYAQAVVSAWAALPNTLKPFSALTVSVTGVDAPTRKVRYENMLAALQEAEIPTVIRIADSDPRSLLPLDLTEELLARFTCVKGVEVVNLSFDEYYTFSGGDELGLPPNVRWLSGATDLAARYGRFIAIRLDGIGWLRLMANAWCRPLLERFRACSAYVVPLAGHGGGDTIAQQSALMGLWMEGAVAQWGVAPSSSWYVMAGYVEPGVFGVTATGPGMPPPLYRAMILNGALGGACVYAFPSFSDLWSGGQGRYWAEAIQPTLHEVVETGLIAGKEFVSKKVRVAYQLGVSRTPEEFHLNLRDLDAVRDQGLLLAGAYGLERPGQVTELIPNSGRHYWVPAMSPHAAPELLGAFARVVRPGSVPSAPAWTELLDQYLGPDGSGTAFIVRVGRGVFVMNTRENLYEEQTFQLPSLPTPVRGLDAVRQERTVTLTWPFREGDVSYSVFRRLYPSGAFEKVVQNIDERTWTDPDSDPATPVAYAVTALTNEQEPYEGVVNYGDYRAFSAVESRIEEEAVLTPLVAQARGRLLEGAAEIRPRTQEWWPNLTGVEEGRLPDAQAIAKRIEQWDAAFTAEDLDGVMDLYGTEYQDPQWWRFQYAKRAYQWFFERYSGCRMTRQIRAWDFSAFDAKSEVRVLLYCRFTGIAISDPTGRTADQWAWFPRTDTSEVWLTFSNKEGEWRIERSDPALPNFADILSFSTGPYDSFPPGPDVFGR